MSGCHVMVKNLYVVPNAKVSTGIATQKRKKSDDSWQLTANHEKLIILVGHKPN